VLLSTIGIATSKKAVDATLTAWETERWTAPIIDEAASRKLADSLGCPAAIAHLLVSRELIGWALVNTFLNPSIDHLHDPMCMLGMQKAVERIQLAVRMAEPILIYGDYDVDGTIATVLLKTAIERIAPTDAPAKVTWHVPHRIREGYGMQNNILGQAAADGIRLVISVDTGIRAFAAAIEAKSLGLDLIVTDHHLPDEGEGVPEALAVINPAQKDCLYPFKELCGAGVAFKLAHALLRAAALTPEGLTRLEKIILPSFLKLVAIATIADSVPLVKENRTIAWLGLRELCNPVQPGLRALIEIAKLPLDKAPSAMDVGFRLAPRINAAGRMDVADDVIELFLTRDVTRAHELAVKLDSLNQDRRTTEAEALKMIEEKLAELCTEDGYPAECIILDDPAWHRGVLGILASRVVDRTGCPALVLTHDDGQAHGSGRSVGGFHLLDALTSGDLQEGGPIFTRFGGHAHAVGFSLPSARVKTLRERMKDVSARGLTVGMLKPRLRYDVELSLRDITPTLWQWLERCRPFGNSHEEPKFMTRSLVLASPVRVLKEKHVCLELEEGHLQFRAMGWGRPGAAGDWPRRCRALDIQKGSRVDVLYRLVDNKHLQYGGLQMDIIDLQLNES
jgi:single-stranded-DNA-specific exonuclease